MYIARSRRSAIAAAVIALSTISAGDAFARTQDDTPEGAKSDAPKTDAPKADKTDKGDKADSPPAEGEKPADPPKKKDGILDSLEIKPFIGIVGGIKADAPLNGPDEHKEARVSAIALSRFGLKGSAGAWVSFESELMASGGTSLHGSSAYEGQAALQVRNQLVRLSIDPGMIEVGRVTDEASVDYYSLHVADVFLQDTATRDPLLYSGLNMGNGVRGTFKLVEGLRVGLAFTAGNPVSNTGTLMVGGTYPPFARVYEQPYQYIGKSANNFPDDSFHMMMISPSILYSSPMFDAKAAFQGAVIDTDTTKTDDQNIRAFNVRANARLKLMKETVVPFFNAAFTKNDTVDPANVARLSADKYTGIVLGGGVDFNYDHPFACAYTCANGVGVQYTQVQYQVGGGAVTRLHYVNLGTSYWITEHIAIGARLAAWISVQNGPPDEGERSLLGTMRFVM